MNGSADPRSPGEPAAGNAGRRARHAAVAWTLVVVAASLGDPAVLLGPNGMSPAAGPDGVGGAGAFAIAHLAAYGVLAWILVGGAGQNTRRPRAVLVAVAVATAAGVGVELLQAPVAARTASVADALVNAVGATAGAELRTALERR